MLFKCLQFLTFLFLFHLFLKQTADATEYGGLECFTVALAEGYVPGAGYLYTRQWDKVAVFGSVRWLARLKKSELQAKDDFQKNVENKYIEYLEHQETDDDENPGRTHYFFNRSTMDFHAYDNFDAKMGWGTGWDIYAHDCQNSPEVYGVIASPFDVKHWYSNWMVWTGLAVAVYVGMNNDEYLHLGSGATLQDYLQGQTFSSVANGFGEEALLRGRIQKGMSDFFGNRHIGIWASNFLFMLLDHQYGMQNRLGNALVGVYFGYVYQPSDQEHDLKSAVALHSWWSFILYSYRAKMYEERQEAFDTAKDGKELTRDFYARQTKIRQTQKFQFINWTLTF